MDPRLLDETGQRFEMVGAKPGATGLPGWLKIAAGCGCALVLAGGLLVGALGAGFSWLAGSGEQFPTAWIADEQTPGAFHTEALGKDPGLAAFVTELFVEVDRLQREAARGAGGRPTWLEGLEQGGGPADFGELGEWLPTDAALVVETCEDDEVEVAGALNLPRFGRLVRSLVKGATAAREPHGDHEVRRAEGQGGPFFAFADGTLLLASGRTALERCLDRLDARAGSEEAGRSATPFGGERLAGLAARSDVVGILRERAALDAALELLSRAEWFEAEDFAWLPADVVDVGLGLDLSTQDELAGEVLVTCPDAGAAEQAFVALQQQIDRWTARADMAELDLAASAVRRDARVEATFRLRGLRGALEDLARYLADSW